MKCSLGVAFIIGVQIAAPAARGQPPPHEDVASSEYLNVEALKAEVANREKAIASLEQLLAALDGTRAPSDPTKAVQPASLAASSFLAKRRLESERFRVWKAKRLVELLSKPGATPASVRSRFATELQQARNKVGDQIEAYRRAALQTCQGSRACASIEGPGPHQPKLKVGVPR